MTDKTDTKTDTVRSDDKTLVYIKRAAWEVFAFAVLVAITYWLMKDSCKQEETTQIFTVFGVMATCATLGLALWNQYRMLDEIAENTKALQALRTESIAKGRTNPNTINITNKIFPNTSPGGIQDIRGQSSVVARKRVRRAFKKSR